MSYMMSTTVTLVDQSFACRSTSIPAPEPTAELQADGSDGSCDSSGVPRQLNSGDGVDDPKPTTYVVNDLESANRTLTVY